MTWMLFLGESSFGEADRSEIFFPMNADFQGSRSLHKDAV
jgi:hypothetical protein